MTDMMKNNRILYSVMLGMVGCFFTGHVMAVTFDQLDLTIRGTIQLPVPCTISGAGGKDEITVKFGNAVSTSQLDGVNYRQKIDYAIDCEPGVNNALKLSIQGFTNFDGALRTSVPNLGIKITHGTQQTKLPMGAYLPFRYPVLPELYATPVKKSGTTLTGQPFSASATLHVSYQ